MEHEHGQGLAERRIRVGKVQCVTDLIRDARVCALRAGMLLAFPIGMTFAAPASLLLRLLGQGGTLIVVARKASGGTEVLSFHTGLHGSTSFVTRSLSFA